MIRVYNDFLSKEDHEKCLKYCIKTNNYKYGEIDYPGFPPTGMVSKLDLNHHIVDLFHKSFLEKIFEVQNLNLNRAYINCFAPSENPFFHIDNNDPKSLTMLYYPHIKWDLNNGGETQFFVDDSITGILPVPNRLVCFSANIMHRATTFRNGHRFTIAFKYV